MAKQTIGIGTTANDGTGDPIRTGGDKINDNFTDLYNRTDGNSPHQVITARVNWSNLSAEFQEQDLIWAAVNADLTHIVKHDHDLQFRTVRKVYGQVGSIKTYDVYETYWHLRDKLTVVNGNNVSLGSGNTQLDSTNGFLVFAGRKVTNVIDGVVQEGGFTRDFGATGATPIEDSVNAGAIAYPSKGLYLFKGNDGTDDYLYIYEGDASEIGTGSGVTTSASDFSILTEASADPGEGSQQTIKIQGDTGEGEFPLAIDFVGADVTQDPITEHAIITITNGGLNVSGFGAKGDGVQLTDFNVTGSSLNSPTAVFTVMDIGKIVSVALAGVGGEHLVTTISAFVDTNNVTLADAATTNVTNQMGSYGTDNIKPLQDAFDYAIANNIKLYCPEGVFLIGDENPDNATFKDVRINFTEDNQNFVFEGAGKGLSIIRELDGKTQRIGRFTKLFYGYLDAVGITVGKINITGFTFDKNGRSITVNPPTLFDWEQAHCVAFAGTATGVTLIDELKFSDNEIFDKIGAGLNFSSQSATVTDFYVTYISQKNFLGNGGGTHPVVGIDYGQRGDIEASPYSENIVISNCSLRYAQIEPTETLKTTSTRPRISKITNSIIDVLEYTEIHATSDLEYNKVFLEGVTSTNLTLRGAYFRASGCDFVVRQVIQSVDGVFTNCLIKNYYDSSINDIISVGLTLYNDICNIKFNQCDFKIDHLGVITPTGYTLEGASVDTLEKMQIELNGCTFDPRYQNNIEVYNNGHWILRNNKFDCTNIAVLAGALSTNTSRVELYGNSYASQIVVCLRIENRNALWTAVIDEDLNFVDWKTAYIPNATNALLYIEKQAMLRIDDIANRTGYHQVGEKAEIISPSAGTYNNYVCTTAGTGLASVWKGYGLIEA